MLYSIINHAGSEKGKPFKQGSDLALLAAYPVVMLDVLGKPLRSTNLKVRVLADVPKMVKAAKDNDGVWIIDEEKTSCKNDKTFVCVKDSRIIQALQTYVTHIRPLLARYAFHPPLPIHPLTATHTDANAREL
jgi:hypothetical protein